MPPASGLTVALPIKPKSKKIIFDEDGKALSGDEMKNHIKKNDTSHPGTQKQTKVDEEDADGQQWYYLYPDFPSSNDVTDIKEADQMELYQLCKTSYEAELPLFQKKNPSDSRWLQTALHKGTAKDRANAGALLVTSNPLGNLSALETLISFTKLSNKSSSEVISVLTALWKEILLPPHRILYSINMRGADWKIVRKNEALSKENKRKIYAYWHFENELKDQYSDFLKNLTQAIQTGQENNKCSAIISASTLLAYAPEKEQLLLSMLINKLGDPLSKVASKALHHLSEVARRHPNMCGVITKETEKLLFRNNIADRAQHFALCFLSSIAINGQPEVCTKLVNICFAFFKVLVKKGAVNNRTMQAILRCLQKAILDAKPLKGTDEIMDKTMQDTIYRLIHVADIHISIQAMSLLLQLVAARATESTERFYNVLYKKMIDFEVTTIGTKASAQLLHVIHRAIHIDVNINRAKAFIKRLLQLALYAPAQMAAGCLIIVQKLLQVRRELRFNVAEEEKEISVNSAPKVAVDDDELKKFDSDGEEKYEDIQISDEEEEELAKIEDVPMIPAEEKIPATCVPSWHHAKNSLKNENLKIKDITALKYDPFHRVPAYAGIEYAQLNELILLCDHFHPSVKLFAENILNQKRITYYGDPLKDFALPHFLERFSFKNPKKIDKDKAETPIIAKKHYRPFGSRGKAVTSLTKTSYTEDEFYIFNYLDRKRELTGRVKSSQVKNDEDDDVKVGDVDDDEFETYLDEYFGKKGKKKFNEVDFLHDIDGKLKSSSSKKKKRNNDEESDDNVQDDIADDGSDDDDDDDIPGDNSNDEMDDDDDDDEDDSDSMPIDDSNSEISNKDMNEDDEPLMKKTSGKRSNGRSAPQLNQKSFAKTLKHSTDMSSLFAAADDFAELLEETGKVKGQGTSNVVFNKDKSSLKQIKWEENRRSEFGKTKNKTIRKQFGKKKKKF